MKIISNSSVGDAAEEIIRQHVKELLRKAGLYVPGFILSIEGRGDGAMEGVFDAGDQNIGVNLSVMEDGRRQCYRCMLTPTVKELSQKGFIGMYNHIRNVLPGPPPNFVAVKGRPVRDLSGSIEWFAGERLAKALAALQGYDPRKQKPTDIIISALQLEQGTMPRVRQVLRRWTKEGLIARSIQGYTVIYAVTEKGFEIMEKYKS